MEEASATVCDGWPVGAANARDDGEEVNGPWTVTFKVALFGPHVTVTTEVPAAAGVTENELFAGVVAVTFALLGDALQAPL